jgi:tetratricopeptide (TPR) repeat protein
MSVYRCLAEMKEWDECLEMLGGIDVDGSEALLAFPTPPSLLGTTLDYLSAMCFLRAQVYDAQENFPRAVQWYKAALTRDPFNYEAFRALVEKHKLPVEEEAAIVAEITARLPSEQRWLGLLYRSKCKQYDTAGVEIGLDAVTALGGGFSSSGGSIAFENGGGAMANDTSANMSDTPSTGGHDVSMSGVTPPPQQQHQHNTTPAMSTRATTRRAGGISPISEGSEGGATAMMMMMGTGGTMTPASGVIAGQGQGVGGGGGGNDTGGNTTTGINRPSYSITWGLGGNADVAASHAELLIRRGRSNDAFEITSAVLEKDPFAEAVLPSYLTAAVSLGKRHELFSLGHKLIKAQPEKAASWYAAGCYYFCTAQYVSARHYFAKATGLDRYFAPAWIGFAQAFAAQDETDQAMAAFRTASRLFPGLHIPLLGMGLEYIRMNNLSLAEQMLLRAYRRCPADAAVAHELGTLALKQGQYTDAVQWLHKALMQIPQEYPGMWEPTVVNLAHAYRKLRKFDLAIEMLNKALGACPTQAGTYSALAYTYHLKGNLSAAIESYHKALGLRPSDDFSSVMLAAAVQEETDAMTASLTKGFEPMGIS